MMHTDALPNSLGMPKNLDIEFEIQLALSYSASSAPGAVRILHAPALEVANSAKRSCWSREIQF